MASTVRITCNVCTNLGVYVPVLALEIRIHRARAKAVEKIELSIRDIRRVETKEQTISTCLCNLGLMIGGSSLPSRSLLIEYTYVTYVRS